MVIENLDICHSYVLYAQYQCRIQSFEEVLMDFLNAVEKSKATIKGTLIYTIDNIPKERIVKGHFYLPVKEPWVDDLSQLDFQSYLSLEHMIGIPIVYDNGNNVEKGYRELVDFIVEHGLEQTTPFFHEINLLDKSQVIMLKCGVL